MEQQIQSMLRSYNFIWKQTQIGTGTFLWTNFGIPFVIQPVKIATVHVNYDLGLHFYLSNKINSFDSFYKE